MKKYFFVCFFLLLFISAFSQRFVRHTEYKDSSHHFVMVGIHLEGDLPFGDMASRFAGNLNVGVPIVYKTQNNMLFGVEGNYFFSGNVRENPLNYMYNSYGSITGSGGTPANIRLNERGFTVYAIIGGIIKALGTNKNSGLMAYAGFGYMEHQIHIADIGRNLAAINGDMKKGYDRLTGGFAMEQFIGYAFLAKNRIVNIYGGFTFQEGFTTGLRGYQYDTMQPDSKKRNDILIGIRLGWFLPLYKKAPKEFYYN
ncbi:MAG: hypothetical protein JST67_11680 [Bacteroidetes bacterium]|nr:hypothetical protein [Bacteroidota bacterium]